MTTEESRTELATAPGDQPKANKKARVAPRRANVGPARAKSGKKTHPAKKASTGGEKPKASKARVNHDRSKAATILDLLKRPDGVTSKELIKVTGWLPHSIRGFLSGTVGKKMGLTVTSSKNEDGDRTYSVKA